MKQHSPGRVCAEPAAVPVVDALAQIAFVVSDVLTAAAAEHELSLTQLRLLGILRDRTPTMAGIATVLGIDRSSVSGLIDRAERRGFVARRTSTEDARVTIIDLTDAGRSIAVELESTVGIRIGRLLEGVSDADRVSVIGLSDSIRGRSRE